MNPPEDILIRITYEGTDGDLTIFFARLPEIVRDLTNYKTSERTGLQTLELSADDIYQMGNETDEVWLPKNLQYLKKQGYSYAKLGTAGDVTAKDVSAWAGGQKCMNYPALRKIARKVGVAFEQLVFCDLSNVETHRDTQAPFAGFDLNKGFRTRLIVDLRIQAAPEPPEEDL